MYKYGGLLKDTRSRQGIIRIDKCYVIEQAWEWYELQIRICT